MDTNPPGDVGVQDESTLPRLQSPGLRRVAGIRHGFFTRVGGVSTGIYGGLNCSFGSGDRARAVAANRERVAEALGTSGDRLFTLKQVHGADVVDVDASPPGSATPGDALVSAAPGVLIGILTADCVPVLLADANAGVVAAVHAGWRGAASGVVAAAVRAMVSRGANRARVVASIGPAICQRSYEVGVDVRDAVRTAAGPQADGFFEPSAGRFLFDLPGFVAMLCRESGVASVDDAGVDTYADSVRFFSYRRTCHRGEADYGRQLSVIGLV